MLSLLWHLDDNMRDYPELNVAKFAIHLGLEKELTAKKLKNKALAKMLTDSVEATKDEGGLMLQYTKPILEDPSIPEEDKSFREHEAMMQCIKDNAETFEHSLIKSHAVICGLEANLSSLRKKNREMGGLILSAEKAHYTLLLTKINISKLDNAGEVFHKWFSLSKNILKLLDEAKKHNCFIQPEAMRKQPAVTSIWQQISRKNAIDNRDEIIKDAQKEAHNIVDKPNM